jgi:hypothetical protein
MAKELFIRKVLVLLVIVTTFSQLSFGQSQYKITGLVKDKSDSLVSGNVLALSTADSSLITGAFFLDGQIDLPGIKAQNILLKITSLGYPDTIFPVGNTGETLLDLGLITISDPGIALNGFEVVASRPIFEQSLDGSTKVNVENTMLEQSTSTMELLGKAPNVVVSDGDISVIGKGNALLYVDGKRVPIDRLGSIPVSQIDQIEVITNPSAKYDAEGRAVINIITKKNPQQGLQGVFTQNTTMAKYFLSTTNLDLEYRKGKLSLSGGYGVSLGQDWGANLMTREVFATEGTYTSINDHLDQSYLTYVANYRLGAGFQISNTSDISVEYSGIQNVYDQDIISSTDFSDPTGNSTLISTTTDGQLNSYNNAVNFNFNKTLDTLGSSLFIGGQYSDFLSENESFIQETIGDGTSAATRFNQSGSGIMFSTAQADVKKNFKGGSSLETGVKYTNASNNGVIDFFSKPNSDSDYVYFPSLSNNFEYAENIPAAYAQFSGEIKKFSYALGARAEYTEAKGTSIALDQTVIDTSYFNVFPNASINVRITNKFGAGLTYSSSIRRPSYQALDPFLFYVDSLTSQQGNPTLIPELAHSIEGSMNYKMYALKVGYTYAQNAFRYALVPADDGRPNSAILQQINIQAENSYYASLVLPFQKKIFQSYNVIGITLDEVVDDRPEFEVTNLTPRFYVYTYNSLKLDKIANVDINGEYMGTRFDGIYYRKPAFSLSLGLSRRILKNKVNVSFMVNDVLKTFEVDGFYALAGSKVSYVRKLNTHFYRLTLAWRFGQLRDVIYNSKNVGEDEYNRIQK